MPTGYTAGIIDGTTKTFEEFAIHCSRAFMVHLRDEPMKSEYKKSVPTDYHSEEITKAKAELKEAESLTDEEIIIKEKNNLIESKKYHKEAKEKDEVGRVKLEQFLAKAMNYKPPTKVHKGIADFMQDQLKKTIDFDFNRTYHIDELKIIDVRIKNINADNVRSEMKKKATKDIAYHAKEHEKELKGCRESNKWYDDFINSLND